MTRKRVHWGQTPFRVKDHPEIGQLSANLNNGVRLIQLWVTFRVKLTVGGSSLTRNGVWPQWTLSGSTSDPGVFRVLVYHLKKLDRARPARASEANLSASRHYPHHALFEYNYWSLENGNVQSLLDSRSTFQ